MGSPTTEAGHKTDENQVEVTLTQGFWMLETEVTQAMYYAFIKKEHPWQEESKTFANYPVTLVSRSDASDFCEKLTAAGRREGVLTTKQQITLPTEARWEYACRAGATTAYSFGDNESGLGVSAWFTKNSYDIGEKYAHEVGRKQPNPWGLLDMHGNVREWCHECYNATLPGGRDPGGSAGGTSSVIRGGDWNGSADQARCSSRQQLYPPGRSGSDIGFRVIVESDTKPIAPTSESAVAPASQSSVAPTQSGSSQPQGPVVSPANPKTVAKPPISKPATPLKTAVPEVPPSKVPEPNTPVVELDSVTAKIKKLTEDATAKFPKSPSKLSDAKLAAIRQDVEKNELEAISSAIDRDRTGREPKALVAVWYEYRASVYRLLGQATNALRDAEIAHDLKTASEVVDP